MYTIVKNLDLKFEYYLNELNENEAKVMLKFRTSNHNLPVETGRWRKLSFIDRKCKLCDLSDVGDEFHYLFVCPFFVAERHLLIDKYYYTKPNMYKMNSLFNCKKLEN